MDHFSGSRPPPHKQGDQHLAVGADSNQKLDTARLEFDFEKYARFLENSDLSEAQKLELLSAVWRIMSEFVMLGWGVHPIQHACGKDDIKDKPPTKCPSKLLDSTHTHLITEFEMEAGPDGDQHREGVDA
jgi:hypothetical protein